jgi:hypothetical protein
MNLKEEIAHYEKEIKSIETTLSHVKKRHSELLILTEIDSASIIRDIEMNDFNLVSLEVKEGNYEYILGGDGRSQPWSEIRKGNIGYLKFKANYYVSNDNRDVIIKYLKSTRRYNDVNIL